MYIKYNTVLRNMGARQLQEQAHQENNQDLFPTTIQLISSGLIKLARLQPCVKLYRGFGGGKYTMPERWVA